MDTDNPDHSSSNDREIDDWPIDPKMKHDLYEYVLEECSTDTDSNESVSDASVLDESVSGKQQQQMPDEQQQQQQLEEEQEEEEEEQHLDFRMPENLPPKKFKNVPVRQQKSRACKRTVNIYTEDFSDDADL